MIVYKTSTLSILHTKLKKSSNECIFFYHEDYSRGQQRQDKDLDRRHWITSVIPKKKHCLQGTHLQYYCKTLILLCSNRPYFTTFKIFYEESIQQVLTNLEAQTCPLWCLIRIPQHHALPRDHFSGRSLWRGKRRE